MKMTEARWAWSLATLEQPLTERVFPRRESSSLGEQKTDRLGGFVQPLFGTQVSDGGKKWESVNFSKMRTPLLSPKLVRM